MTRLAQPGLLQPHRVLGLSAGTTIDQPDRVVGNRTRYLEGLVPPGTVERDHLAELADRIHDLGRPGGPRSLDEQHPGRHPLRSEEHTSELQSRGHLVCRLLLEKKKVAEDVDHFNTTID